MTSASGAPVHVVLLPGYWLGAWAWDDVAPHLERAGLAPHPVTLPGLGSELEDRAGIELRHHVAAVRELISGLEGPVVLVGHSGGALVVQGVVEADPDRIARVVYVDAGPAPDGMALFPDLPADEIDYYLPTWGELNETGNSTEGLDEAALARFRKKAVPQPAGVARSPVRLINERRKQVPVTVVCCSMPAAAPRTAMEHGEPWVAELVGADLELVDLPTGHWPMFSRPADLAAVLVEAAKRHAPVVGPDPARTLRGLSTVTYWADDVAAAVRWYTEVLGVEPYFVRPPAPAPAAYVEFRIGDYQHELGIIDRRYAPAGAASGPGGAVAYWHVDDVRGAYDRLLAMGATPYENVTEREAGFVTASVVDPFGNVLGLMHSPHYLEILGREQRQG
ncbi:alpha/beta fold hydrolase [Georgenia sp. AZ-5]|uniref:alpha/beta fold hydrolase n=1 Tax=Georgenia sp. AZ-5 TaxID=3367526 RepID=UPI003755092E